MDKEQIIRAMRAGRAGVDVWDRLNDEVKDKVRNEFGRMADGVMEFIGKSYLPEIPEEVRDYLLLMMDFLKDTTCPESIRVRQMDGPAREWLAKCPTATNRAVCPHCGCEELYNCEVSSGQIVGDCNGCGGRFNGSIDFIISPPREPKETP